MKIAKKFEKSRLENWKTKAGTLLNPPEIFSENGKYS
jgi:hypothetical protein